MNNPIRHPLFLYFSFWFPSSSSPHYCPVSFLIARCSLAGAPSPSFGYCNVNCNLQEEPETSLAAASVHFVSLAGAAALLPRLSVGMPFQQLLRRTPTVEVGRQSKGLSSSSRFRRNQSVLIVVKDKKYNYGDLRCFGTKDREASLLFDFILMLLVDMTHNDLAVTSSLIRTTGPSTWSTQRRKLVGRRYGGASGRATDLAQVRPNPQRLYGRPDTGGHDSCADSQLLLEDDDRPRVPFTRIKPRAVHGHGRGFPRPHQPSPSTGGDGADHNPIPTTAHASDGSPIGSPGGTPTNGVTSGPEPRNPARRRGATASGHRSPPSFPDPNASPFSKSLQQSGTDRARLRHPIGSPGGTPAREQVRRVHQRLDEVQKEVLKSREEVGESSKSGSPFTPEIQAKPLPATFKLPALEPYDGSGDPTEHIATFRTQMALYDTSEALMCRAFPTTLRGSARTWDGPRERRAPLPVRGTVHIAGPGNIRPPSIPGHPSILDGAEAVKILLVADRATTHDSARDATTGTPVHGDGTAPRTSSATSKEERRHVGLIAGQAPPIPLNSTQTEIFFQIWEKGLLKAPSPMKSHPEQRDKRRSEGEEHSSHDDALVISIRIANAYIKRV
ncbi:hypothetical protein BHE74_00052212, partial [Ensete ventricosum]